MKVARIVAEVNRYDRSARQNSACNAIARSYSLRRMRALATVCLLVSLATSAWIATAAEATHTNAVSIVSARKSDWRIVSPSAKAPGVEWAAKELQKYLRQMTTCELPIAGRLGSKPAFVIGLRQRARHRPAL